jgi:hypothetical protein
VEKVEEKVEKREGSNPTELLASPDQDSAEYPSGFRRYAIGLILGLSIVLPMLVWLFSLSRPNWI